MDNDDRERWNRKWLERDDVPAPHGLLRRYAPSSESGIAVDVACGLGQNTLFLAELGYEAFGFDLSGVALGRAVAAARERGLERRATFVQCDLAFWHLRPASVDLLCVFRFLDRALFRRMRAAVKAGGLLFYETRNVGVLDRLANANPDYLLDPGELLDSFSEWKVIYHDEGPENSSLVARRP